MLDIHVLTLPGLPEEFEKERRASLELAIANAGFPVKVHEVPGIAAAIIVILVVAKPF